LESHIDKGRGPGIFPVREISIRHDSKEPDPMPLYEYKCRTCGNVDEHLMRMSDPHPAGCTKCEGPVEKLLSQTSFALKGSGWYVTDYKPGRAGEAKADATGEAAAVPGGGSVGVEGAPGAVSTEGKGAEGKGAEGKGAESKSVDGKATGIAAAGASQAASPQSSGEKTPPKTGTNA
jgi:putative FmdB family regulatory protein